MAFEITSEDIDAQVESLRMLGAHLQKRLPTGLDDDVLAQVVRSGDRLIVHYHYGATPPLDHAVLARVLNAVMSGSTSTEDGWRAEKRGRSECMVRDIRIRDVYGTVIIGGRQGPPSPPS